MPKNITRIDSETAHGWLVRMQRKKKKLAKFFSDYAHGGEEPAMKQAKEFLTEIDNSYSTSFISVFPSGLEN